MCFVGRSVRAGWVSAGALSTISVTFFGWVGSGAIDIGGTTVGATCGAGTVSASLRARSSFSCCS